MAAWERLLADYGSTGITLREHPLELLRPSLGAGVRSSADLETLGHGERVEVAGLVLARQRPATAKGITFMLLEDEHGTINLIVPVPVYERCRLVVRAEPLLTASGRLERRDGVVNVVVGDVSRLERPELPPSSGHGRAQVTTIEPRKTWSTEAEGGEHGATGAPEAEDLRALAPVAHSFGARGR
ncbi:MAG: hypothetical protein H0V85_07430 [Thermoleophilaceae bacterium]|nr:hypothetical protein [Thermoleophilaceae bacterium]